MFIETYTQLFILLSMFCPTNVSSQPILVLSAKAYDFVVLMRVNESYLYDASRNLGRKKEALPWEAARCA